MPQFRKKPVVIEAAQWDGKDTTAHTLMRWSGWATYRVIAQPDVLHIRTLEGDMVASSGDWIIKGVAGEFYPCKPDIFASTYEPAEPLPAPERPEEEFWRGADEAFARATASGLVFDRSFFMEGWRAALARSTPAPTNEVQG